ncbi:MAG: type I-MYXAN CRISPR-associated protein Cas6/Cmx6 [Arenicellales bacterium]|nr:type I-MYXAN CRISPR-associated protein Cas6/Cmx6 [Arenicellales bacterium]
MYWQEPSGKNEYEGLAKVIDVAFRIRCPCLPVDHAYDLFQAVAEKLPWIANEDLAGIHSIRSADSGNGWYRPEQEDGSYMQLSKRVRLILRVPATRLDQCSVLCGETLNVSDQQITVNNYKVRRINPTPTLFARGVLTDTGESENTFVERAHESLKKMNIKAPKILPGRKHQIKLPGGHLVTRSLLLADVTVEDSVKLQERGLGENRKFGCGLFIPHKSIGSVRPND